MVDALAWKNQQHSLRRCHPMEDSTDTLVDDASVRAVQLLQLDDTTGIGPVNYLFKTFIFIGVD